ncbi:hypothetical protein ESCO_001161 [Escovopsis weberi]|uniref:Uncharacterized protein n=1 Tax=Escovopsis weberi TaxID=150374 RepID=A0A0N0RTH4_ESCWE|nr:hypothetical protein ESCO_001161 [Escovopsis weberi]
MHDAASDARSPKIPRRPKISGEAPRHAHFQAGAPSSSSSSSFKAAATAGLVPPATSLGGFRINVNSRGRAFPDDRDHPPGIQNNKNTIVGGGIDDDDNDDNGNGNNNVDDGSTSQSKPSGQPESFPQLGAFPSSSADAGQWHTAADPTQSLKPPGFQLPPGLAYLPQYQHHHHPQAAGFSYAAQHPHLVTYPFSPFSPTTSPPHITYVGLQHPQVHTASVMADYQNAAPPPTGVNFQPPVPDTTYGTIPHLYVPRFDGGFVPAAGCVQVCPPSSLQLVPTPQAACTTTIIMPKTQPAVVNQHGYVVAQQPAFAPQPMVGHQQPVMIGAPPVSAPIQPFPAMGMGMSAGGAVPFVAGNIGQPPEVSGLGRTPGEETIRQLNFAHSNKLFEPQEFKPSDDDPSRFYYVREVDGNWTQRNRFTIDHLGDCRWYVTDEGWFYAVRMPN